MERWEALLRWIDERRDMVFDLMRIYLGIGLFVKGIQFIGDREFLLAIMQDSETMQFKFRFLETFLGHYIPLAHLGGGLLLAALTFFIGQSLRQGSPAPGPGRGGRGGRPTARPPSCGLPSAARSGSTPAA